MSLSQRRRRIRRERRHHYRVRLAILTIILLFGAIACLYVDVTCSNAIEYHNDYDIKYDWEYEQELEELGISPY